MVASSPKGYRNVFAAVLHSLDDPSNEGSTAPAPSSVRSQHVSRDEENVVLAIGFAREIEGLQRQ
jgi:hypothetical protein